jgi:hypothetical protein
MASEEGQMRVRSWVRRLRRPRSASSKSGQKFADPLGRTLEQPGEHVRGGSGRASDALPYAFDLPELDGGEDLRPLRPALPRADPLDHRARLPNRPAWSWPAWKVHRPRGRRTGAGPFRLGCRATRGAPLADKDKRRRLAFPSGAGAPPGEVFAALGSANGKVTTQSNVK